MRLLMASSRLITLLNLNSWLDLCVIMSFIDCYWYILGSYAIIREGYW